jgi:hypothetical protein
VAEAVARLHPLNALLAALLLSLCAVLPAAAEMPDLTPLDGLLHRHVHPGVSRGIPLNRVDYAAWAADPDYPKALDAFARFDPARLETRAERLAFWIDAYNLLAIRTVIDTGVTGSIKDAGNLFSPVWKRTAGVVGGREVSLDRIEHKVLRPLGEPRIHLAIVCASLSCPDLRLEVYTPDRLDAQLDDQAQRFLANPAKGLAGSGDVRVSRIFDWFEADFGGPEGVLRFLKRHAPGRDVARVAGYLPYDWSLNADRP